jgi:cbb3-type cytochrome oxidase subunit 3
VSDDHESSAPEASTEPVRPPAKDPMKSFRGVMAGALIMEAITVALAVPVVARLGGGVGTGKGWTVIALAVVLVLCCGVLKRPWIVPVILAIQVGLMAFFFSITAIGVIGLLFLAFWLWALWLRRDVARRMAAGTLPSQQQPVE